LGHHIGIIYSSTKAEAFTINLTLLLGDASISEIIKGLFLPNFCFVFIIFEFSFSLLLLFNI